MFISFEELPSTSRIWIYQADQVFSTEEIAVVEKDIEAFLNTWESHGSPVNGSYKIYHNQFIVIAVDERTSPSGCSIDKSVALIKKIELDFNVDLFNRMNLIYIDNNKDLKKVNLQNIKQLIADGEMSASTLVFNNMITVKAQLETEWCIPASSTWVNRYF